MQEGAAVEVGPQGQDQTDIGGTARRRIGEAGQQHVDETLTDGIVLDQREDFLELIGDADDIRTRPA